MKCKKQMFLAGMLVLAMGFAACDDDDKSDECGDEFAPYCADEQMQIRCSENGIVYKLMCANGCSINSDNKSECVNDGYKMSEYTCPTGCGVNEVCRFGQCVVVVTE